jgi:hypothetical protein
MYRFTFEKNRFMTSLPFTLQSATACTFACIQDETSGDMPGRFHPHREVALLTNIEKECILIYLTCTIYSTRYTTLKQ